MRIYGLTGNTGTGKTSVADGLRRAGIPVVDADAIAREIVEPGRPALAEIVATLGEGYLDASGHLDRQALAKRVFSDPEARAKLDAITHARIAQRAGERFRELADQGTRLAVFDAALLVESGMSGAFSGLIVVRAEREQQVERIMRRDGLSRQDAEQRVDAQMPLSDKVRLADYVVDNSGDLEHLKREIRALVDWLEPQP